jgi:hypothetical protein
MRLLRFSLPALALAGAASAAHGQSTTATAGPFPVTGNVPALCSGGTLTGTGTFPLGVLIDTGTGLLRNDLTAPAQVLTSAFCTGRSTITISATPLASVNNIDTPPGGFSRTINYTATAAGWTAAPATFTTGAATNTNASKIRDNAFQGDITVSIGAFTTGGGNALRLVSDPSYVGSVTVTLAATN